MSDSELLALARKATETGDAWDKYRLRLALVRAGRESEARPFEVGDGVDVQWGTKMPPDIAEAKSWHVCEVSPGSVPILEPGVGIRSPDYRPDDIDFRIRRVTKRGIPRNAIWPLACDVVRLVEPVRPS